MMLLRLLACCLLCAVALAGSLSSARAGAPERHPYIVVLKPGSDRQAAVASARAAGADVVHEYAYALNGYAAVLPDAAVEALRRTPSVLFVGADREVQTAARSTQVLPAGLDRVQADRSRTRVGDGRGAVGVNVAVLDTGIDPSHPDLNVAGGVNCTNEKSFVDVNGHGTHVAGTVGALDNAFGVVGAAPGVRLWAVRVLNDRGFGKWSTIICGIDFVIQSRLNADPGDDIAVMNMSLSGPGADDGDCGRSSKDALHAAVCAASDAGVVAVVSAGNSGSDFSGGVPASYDEVLTVTAMGDYDGIPGGKGVQSCHLDYSFPDDGVAFFSNYSTLVGDQAHTIAAPGVCVLSTLPGGEYGLISGTSQSAPAVAGAAALCVAAGACTGTGKRIMERIVHDTASYNLFDSSYGFSGDPLRPTGGRHYGYLLHAGGY